MYKKIVVAVDGSNTGNLALFEAIKLAKEQNSELRVVHVFDENALSFSKRYPNAVELQKTFIDAGKDVLTEANNIAQQQNIKVETVFLESLKGISKELVDYAKKCSADIIVIGTHGRTGIDRLLLGSVAEKLVRLSTIPVLLVPGK